MANVTVGLVAKGKTVGYGGHSARCARTRRCAAIYGSPLMPLAPTTLFCFWPLVLEVKPEYNESGQKHETKPRMLTASDMDVLGHPARSADTLLALF